MKENVIISLADAKYYELLDELFNSIKHFKKSGVRYEEPDCRYGASGFGASIYFYDIENNKVELKAL